MIKVNVKTVGEMVEIMGISLTPEEARDLAADLMYAANIVKEPNE